MQQANAQSYVYGSSSINYNPSTNMVTGYATTELDFAAQDFYLGQVNGTLKDLINGTVFSGAAASDNDRDGTVTVTTEVVSKVVEIS